MASLQVKIKLRDVVYGEDAIGNPTKSLVTETEVFAFRESIRASDFFNALAHDKRLIYKFSVRSNEYTDQLEVEYDGAIYIIDRTFEPSSDFIELFVTRARGENV